MGKNRASRRRYSQVVAGIAALVSLVFGACPAEAAGFLGSCTTYCHGTSLRDGARKGSPRFGSQSSAFLGNHKNHLSVAPSTNDCSICHTPVAATTYGHQNNIIDMAVKLKGYSTSTGRAKYDKGVFFNQTSIPSLTTATCSNVNCHFEKKTPVWGSAAYNVTTDCNACHGAPPAGTVGTPAGGLAGSHARHDAYYPGTGNCQKCHPGHATFTHATSAGRALKVQGYLRNPLNALEASGTYSGTGANYLPGRSASQVFGTCGNIYCHSTGQSATGTGTGITYKAVTWGSAALTCAGCHVDEATDATGTGSHRVHTIATGANFDCVRCHLGYTKTSVTPATHVNSLIELGAAGFTYSQGSGATHPAANGYGTCSASACHGTGAVVTWGSTLWSTSDQCGKCHSSTAAGAITQAAPFYSTSYPTKVIANTDAKVGAHTSHATAPDGLANTFTCADCHGTVTLNSASHMNGATNFTWSTLATKGGTLAPTYTAATGVCANVYCHGAGMPGGDTTGTNRAPAWTSTTYLPATIGAGGTACKTCHGFPPLPASGHPALATAVPATFGNGTVAIGTSCNCHANINTAGTTYANIFVNKAQHIDGTMQVSGGHAVPYDTHNAAVVAAGGNTACLGCHAMGTSTSVYPAAVVGNSPDCMSCHKKAAPLHTGTTAGANCSSCHGLSTATTTKIGRPVGAAYPDRLGFHSGAQDGAHGSAACTVCHSGSGTTSGKNSGINHGKGSTAGPVRNGKPNVVGPMVNGITPTNSAKGVGTPANGTTCAHGTISSGCSGGGTKSNSW